MTIVKHEEPKIMSLERYLRGVCVFKCGFILNIRNPGAKMPPPPSPIRGLGETLNFLERKVAEN